MNEWANVRVKPSSTAKERRQTRRHVHIRQQYGSCSRSLKENIQSCCFLLRKVNGPLAMLSSCPQPSNHMHTPLRFSLLGSFATSPVFSVAPLLCSLWGIWVPPWGVFFGRGYCSQTPGIITAGHQMLVLQQGKTGFFLFLRCVFRLGSRHGEILDSKLRTHDESSVRSEPRDCWLIFLLRVANPRFTTMTVGALLTSPVIAGKKQNRSLEAHFISCKTVANQRLYLH